MPVFSKKPNSPENPILETSKPSNAPSGEEKKKTPFEHEDFPESRTAEAEPKDASNPEQPGQFSSTTTQQAANTGDPDAGKDKTPAKAREDAAVAGHREESKQPQEKSTAQKAQDVKEYHKERAQELSSRLKELQETREKLEKEVVEQEQNSPQGKRAELERVRALEARTLEEHSRTPGARVREEDDYKQEALETATEAQLRESISTLRVKKLSECSRQELEDELLRRGLKVS